MNANYKPLFPRLGAAITRLPAGTLTILTILAILWLTLAPDPLPSTGMKLFPGADKVVHAVMFGALPAAWFIDRRRHGHTPTTGQVWLAAALSALAGGLIEILQALLPTGRTADWRDFLADCAGAIVAAAVCSLFVRPRRKG